MLYATLIQTEMRFIRAGGTGGGGLGGLQPPPQYLHQDNVSDIYFGEGGGNVNS